MRALVSRRYLKQFLDFTIMNPCPSLSSVCLHFIHEEVEAKESNLLRSPRSRRQSWVWIQGWLTCPTQGCFCAEVDGASWHLKHLFSVGGKWCPCLPGSCFMSLLTSFVSSIIAWCSWSLCPLFPSWLLGIVFVMDPRQMCTRTLPEVMGLSDGKVACMSLSAVQCQDVLVRELCLTHGVSDWLGNGLPTSGFPWRNFAGQWGACLSPADKAMGAPRYPFQQEGKTWAWRR